jgi:NADH dehydrogenase
MNHNLETVPRLYREVRQGWLARMMDLSLYKMHELALHGFWKVTLDTAVRLITRRTEANVKLR